MKTLQEGAQKALEALIWTTGSADFGEGGKAREGALNLLFPAIADLRAALEEPIESKQFMYCENQDGGMDVFMVSSEQDLQHLYGWMKTAGDFDCSQDDQEMVDWMQVADIGEVHFHRLGCLVRLKDKK